MLAQHSVFEDASLILMRMLCIDLSAKQIHRVSQWYGVEVDSLIQANEIEYIPQLTEPNKEDEKTYIMLDGSMVFTREDGWKENKLARLFHSSQNIEIQSNRNEITESIYVSHLGSIHDFLPKLERHINLIKTPKIFVADGAKWIWNWVEDNYPGAVQILDYYHAVEKLGHLATQQFTKQNQKQNWMQKQTDLLFEDKVEEVIRNIRSLKSRNAEVKKTKHMLMNYYTENEDRMLYGTYKKNGILLGSGPIEAANRTIIQQRMKLSGQKWTKKGANAIANLRCYQKSNAWDIVEKMIKLAA